MSILLFSAGNNNRLALNLLSIKSVRKVGDLCRYPGSSAYVCGVSVDKTSVITVIDLPKLLYGAESSAQYMIVLDESFGSIALKVSNIDKLLKDTDEIEAKERRMRSFLKEVLIREGEPLAQMLDLERILDHALGDQR